MQIGVDSFAAAISDRRPAQCSVRRAHATSSGRDRARGSSRPRSVSASANITVPKSLDSALQLLASAATLATKKYRRPTSAVTVLTSAPRTPFPGIRHTYLISHGCAEIVAGRAQIRVKSYPLFGLRLEDYDELFTEKLDLLLAIRENTHVKWYGDTARPSPAKPSTHVRCRIRCPSGSSRGRHAYLLPAAVMLGLPLMVAIIGGQPRRFRPLARRLPRGRMLLTPLEGTVPRLHPHRFRPYTTQPPTASSRVRVHAPPRSAQDAAGRRPLGAVRRLRPTGALLIGERGNGCGEILEHQASLGGLSRITFQMGVSTLPHGNTLRAIEILRHGVAPMVRRRLAATSPARKVASREDNELLDIGGKSEPLDCGNQVDTFGTQ